MSRASHPIFAALAAAAIATSCGTRPETELQPSLRPTLQSLVVSIAEPEGEPWEAAASTAMAEHEQNAIESVLGSIAAGGVGLVRGAPALTMAFAAHRTGPTSLAATFTRHLSFNFDYSHTPAENVINVHRATTAANESEARARATLRTYCERSCDEPQVHAPWNGKRCRLSGDLHREGSIFWHDCEVWEPRPDNCRAAGGNMVHPIAGCDYVHTVVEGTFTSTFACELGAEERWACTATATHGCTTRDTDPDSRVAPKNFCHYWHATLWEPADRDLGDAPDARDRQDRQRRLERVLGDLFEP